MDHHVRNLILESEEPFNQNNRLEAISKIGFWLKVKPPARRAYAPEGHVKRITAGILKYVEDLKPGSNTEICPPLADWAPVKY